MKKLLFLVLAAVAFAQTPGNHPLDREASDRRLISSADPAVAIEFAKGFKYAGGQRITIYGVAEAEQYFFVDAAEDRTLSRWYLLQFEHYLPDNTRTYKYDLPEEFHLGPLNFTADLHFVPGFFTEKRDPASDGFAAQRLLQRKGYRLDGTFAVARMFHLPDPEHRKELMVVYGERVKPDTAESYAKRAAFDHARQNITFGAK
jgi:hypothetical protein